ncbi:DUF58 domain-containing protein [Pseudocolwellia agarivorans]|uniref:DUF58 domain-containing protein n=1 Tax=Pseudocolwellia agarivorans TaxID=1911682 RepID=UPI00098635CD|nr:DUF58 domain-containing protein [Pseudocolwellia agarivorans]
MKRIAFKPSYTLIKVIGVLIALFITVKALGSDETSYLSFIDACALLIALFCIVDFNQSRKPPQLSITRLASNKLSFNRWHSIEYVIENNSNSQYALSIREHVGQQFQLAGLPNIVHIFANQKATVRFKLKSTQRGQAIVGPIEFCLTSPARLWQSYWLVNDTITVKTYPDFERLKQQSLNGVQNQPINGLKQMKKRGGGTEFHQLREFRQGDSIRQIDWQATSKRQKLIAKEYQEEQNQHVVVMLDAGNKMNIETAIGSHFDAALNALLMLSHTVLKQGDWFSMQSFNQKERWLPAVKGAQNVSRVMNHFYDLHPDETTSDYQQAVTHLLKKRSKRALVLMVTTLNDQSIEELLPALKNLQRHHLVALVNIENVALTETVSADIDTLSEAHRYCAAIDLQNIYRKNLNRLRKENIICVNSQPEHLLPQVINTYLSVKHAGLL